VGDEKRLASFAEVLRYLRELGEPCVPPVGIGAFDLLCVGEREILVWYTPARDGHSAGERAIPTRCLADAWEALRAGTAMDEAALAAIGASPITGRWLLALLAQLPGVRVREEGPITVALISADSGLVSYNIRGG
jgi:hypothetical protein